MREIEFKMERPELVSEGDEITVTELGGTTYSYIIEPAVAMSGCFPIRERLKTDHGIVKEVKETQRGYYVTVVFEE